MLFFHDYVLKNFSFLTSFNDILYYEQKKIFVKTRKKCIVQILISKTFSKYTDIQGLNL